MTAANDAAPILELSSVSKAYGHVVALSRVDLAVRRGEVLALVGDNGAGKSTLIKIISGVHRMDAGEITVDGRETTIADPRSAQALGIATVFQDLAMVDALSVAENLYLGQTKRRFGVFENRRAMHEGAASTLARMGVSVPSVRVPIGMLSGGQRQAVAIARAVHQERRIILLDEPTAALGVRESGEVVEIIRGLRARGKAIVLVSHDMELVFDLAQRIQVLRLGEVRAVRDRSDTTREEIVGLITGAIRPAESSAQ